MGTTGALATKGDLRFATVAVIASHAEGTSAMDAHTIPAHIEDGAIRLDAPLPPLAERVEVVVYTSAAKPKRSLSAYVRSLPPGDKTGDEIEAEMREMRDWGR